MAWPLGRWVDGSLDLLVFSVMFGGFLMIYGHTDGRVDLDEACDGAFEKPATRNRDPQPAANETVLEGLAPILGRNPQLAAAAAA